MTVVYYEFLPKGHTINTGVYHRQLNECHRKLHIKQSTLVSKSGTILLQDGIRPHVEVGNRQKIQDLEYECLSPSLYSPELVPTDNHMFRQLGSCVRGKQFSNQDAFIQEVREVFDQCDADFCLCGIILHKTGRAKCIYADSGYFAE
ncbi:histone-lysine N-methyltransferase SETMAR [Trichonephila inaurata madagascariensis]|uniref:Histone-lysine N-methyltransferase SETMAR n=1 Tax=Trichonephila inaurata madagascariensis TaxID=2747483 RepID=A0A8X6XAV6_9ARAC|nr:histone-lysine N-methyltransferase SETMAR [Trichonephila inaurata madagascariensis]